MKSPHDIYVKLSRPIDAGAGRQYGTLRLSVIHRHAGIDVSAGCMESTHLGVDQWVSGFLMPLNGAARKKPHYIRHAMSVLEEMKERVADAFLSHDGGRLANIAALIHAHSVKPVVRQKA